MVNNIFLTFVLGDFNAKSSLWYNKIVTTYEVYSVTSQFGSQKMKKEPTHIIGDSQNYLKVVFPLKDKDICILNHALEFSSRTITFRSR